MKRNTWIVEIYFDDEKQNLLFRKTYKNIEQIKIDFNLKKNWFYDIFRRTTRNYQTYKKSFEDKYKRMKIHKIAHRKSGDTTETFSI